jgi:uncharacterized protein YutE (UPF0331/DUF86 family)
LLNFDQNVLIRIVGELRKSLQRLSALAGIPEDQFVTDADKVASAKYHFIVAIEACIDLCNHLISRNSFRVPEDYGDTFRVMAEVGALSPEFVDVLVNMGKFRNRLVHIYWEVDNRQVHQLLCNRLQDFRRFLKEMAQYLALNEIAE